MLYKYFKRARSFLQRPNFLFYCIFFYILRVTYNKIIISLTPIWYEIIIANSYLTRTGWVIGNCNLENSIHSPAVSRKLAQQTRLSMRDDVKR